MIITLDSTFEIANGVERTARLLSRDQFSMNQATQVEVLSRASWASGFYANASRSIARVYEVTHPPCATLDAALAEALGVPVACPKGGALVETVGDSVVSFADSWVQSIDVRRNGLTNTFIYSLQAINPDTSQTFLQTMSANYVLNLGSITGLTGGTASDLDGYATSGVSVGLTAFITPTIGGIVRPLHMRLIAGTTAENADPDAGSLVVRPDDYNASTNAKVWVEVG